MMLMAMLTKLMHITIQLHQQIMMNVDDNEKTNVKTIKIIQKLTKNQKKGITKSIKV